LVVLRRCDADAREAKFAGATLIAKNLVLHDDKSASDRLADDRTGTSRSQWPMFFAPFSCHPCKQLLLRLIGIEFDATRNITKPFVASGTVLMLDRLDPGGCAELSQRVRTQLQ
jgi:hypothetical protein